MIDLKNPHKKPQDLHGIIQTHSQKNEQHTLAGEFSHFMFNKTHPSYPVLVKAYV